MKKKYLISGIDLCKLCSKGLRQNEELPEVESVTLSFTTQQLYVEAEILMRQ